MSTQDKNYYSTRMWLAFFGFAGFIFGLYSILCAISNVSGIFNDKAEITDVELIGEYINVGKVNANYIALIILLIVIICGSIVFSFLLKKMNKSISAFIPTYLATLVLCINLLGTNRDNTDELTKNKLMVIAISALMFIASACYTFYKLKVQEKINNYNEDTELIYNKNGYPTISVGRAYGEANKIEVSQEAIARRDQDKELIKNAEDGFRTALWFNFEGWGKTQEIKGARWLDLKDKTKVYVEWSIKIGDTYKKFFINPLTYRAVRLSDSQRIDDYNNGIKYDEEYETKLVRRVNMRLATVFTGDLTYKNYTIIDWTK